MERKQATGQSLALHPLDDVERWLDTDFSAAPETAEWVEAFQKRIDAAFGAERGIVLAWAGDRSCWEEFYSDWTASGKGKTIEKKPLALWHEFTVNEFDYLYVYPPRWVLLERHHRAQYAPSWAATCYVEDTQFFGGKKQMRPLTPPPEYFTLFVVIGVHEQSVVIGETPPCCQRADAAKSPCFGRYRAPCEIDLQAVGRLKDFLAKEKAQRPDTPINAATLQRASIMTRHYIEQTQRARAKAMRDFALLMPKAFLGENLGNRGITRSPRELEAIINEAFDITDDRKVKEKQLS